MYVSRGRKLYTAPFGSEYLGDSSEGVPMVYYRAGWVGPMVCVHPRDPNSKEAA